MNIVMLRANPKLRHFSRTVLSVLALCCTVPPAKAVDMQALDDTALSDVTGRDGLSFAINLNTKLGAAIIGTNDYAGNPATLALDNVVVTGSVGGTLDVVAGKNGAPDYVNWAFPNLSGLNNLQLGADLLATAGGTSLGTGIQMQNVAFGGTNMQLTGGANGGISFGLGLNLNIGDVLLQPNGRGVSTGQMDISGIVVGAAGSNGSTPWALADLNTQPGLFTVVADASGNSTVQTGIGWPTTPGTAPAGSLQIGNITFTTPGGNVNLGSSSIGSIQIQYLNVKFKTGT